MRSLLRRLRYWISRRRREADLAEELETHRALRQQQLERDGLPRDDAYHASRRALGNDTLSREDARAVWIWPWLEDLARDLRHGVRMLLQNPAFSAVAVLSLALGIGANTAIFSVMDAIWWRPLPVQEPERLVRVRATTSASGPGLRAFPGALLYPQLGEKSPVFSGVLLGGAADGLSLSVAGATERVLGEPVSGNYFAVLGVAAAHGRTFSPLVVAGTWAPEAVLSYDFWQRRFGDDPSAVGTVIELNGYPFTIVGVSARGFFGTVVGTSFEVRVPMPPEALGQTMPAMPLLRNARASTLTARLRSGVTLEQAQAATEVAWRNAVDATPELASDPQARASHVELVPSAAGISPLRQQFDQPLTILMAMVATVLLIACANVATLLLGRAAARRREFAVRLAIGAGRARIVRQLLTESALLAVLGALPGVALAHWGVSVLFAFLPQSHVPTALDLAPDLRALGFTLAVSLLTAVLFGLAPALRATRMDLVSAVKGRDTGSDARGFTLRKALVVSEVALSLLLLIGATLFVRTLHNLRGVATGFQPDDVMLFTMKHVHERYTPEQLRSFCRELVERVSALPGVRAAGLAETGPFSGRERRREIGLPGAEGGAAALPLALVDRVSPGFLAGAGIPLLSGRDLSAADSEGAPRVALVDETAARAVFGRANPVGARLLVGRRPRFEEYEIVGLVEATKHESLREQPLPAAYLSLAQGEKPWMPTLYVRASGGAAGLGAAVQQEIRTLDQDLPVFNVKSLRRQVEESASQERLVGALSAFFAALAALLAAIGLYGIMAYSVSRRVRELGVRQALGARRADLLWLVLHEALRLVLAGACLGLAGALLLGRLIASALYGLAPTDGATIVSATALLLGTALVSAYLPARRAARLDPSAALRCE